MLGCGGRREILLVCLQMKNSSHVKISEDCRYAKVSLASFGQDNPRETYLLFLLPF
jgi:hypothetical protein